MLSEVTKLFLKIIILVICAIIMIPLSIVLFIVGNYNMSITAIISCTLICLLVFRIYGMDYKPAKEKELQLLLKKEIQTKKLK